MAPQLTEHHFNPAGRLYSFLEFSTSQGNVVIEDVWTSYFEAKPSSPEYFTGLTAVLDLPRQIRRAVDALPPDALRYRSKDKLLRPLPTARDALRLGIENPRSGTNVLTNELATHALFDLEICSDVLRGNWQSDGDLKSATATLEAKTKKTLELVDDLSKALGELPDLDAELRFTLLDAVQRIRRSIDLYRVLGPESLGQARDQLVGAIVMNPTIANQVRKNPSVGKKVAALVVVLGSFVSLFNGTATALETTTNFVQSIEAPASEAPSSDASSGAPSEPKAPKAP